METRGSDEFVFATELARRAGRHYAPDVFPENEEDSIGSRANADQIVVHFGIDRNAVSSILASDAGPLLLLMTRATSFECQALLAERPNVRVEEVRE